MNWETVKTMRLAKIFNDLQMASYLYAFAIILGSATLAAYAEEDVTSDASVYRSEAVELQADPESASDLHLYVEKGQRVRIYRYWLAKSPHTYWRVTSVSRRPAGFFLFLALSACCVVLQGIYLIHFLSLLHML